jgi:hypothetical protein
MHKVSCDCSLPEPLSDGLKGGLCAFCEDMEECSMSQQSTDVPVLCPVLTCADLFQAARIAATEPDVRASIANQLKPLNLLKTAARAGSTAVKVAFGPGPAPAAVSQQQQQQKIAEGQTPAVKDVFYSDKVRLGGGCGEQ